MTDDETTNTETEDGESRGPTGDTTDDTTDWRAGIADERLRRYADTYASPADLAKAALDLRQKLSNAVTVPGKGASEEEHATFRKRLGIPDTPDGYEVEIPEGIEMSAAGQWTKPLTR